MSGRGGVIFKIDLVDLVWHHELMFHASTQQNASSKHLFHHFCCVFFVVHLLHGSLGMLPAFVPRRCRCCRCLLVLGSWHCSILVLSRVIRTGNGPITEYSLPVVYLNMSHYHEQISNMTTQTKPVKLFGMTAWSFLSSTPEPLSPSANHDRSIPNLRDRNTGLTEFSLLGAFTLTGLRDAFRNSEYLGEMTIEHTPIFFKHGWCF